MLKPKFIGILSCSGEEFPGGTVSRIATRTVLQEYLPLETTTICVPLFLAGDDQEQDFVRNFPCITVDGCEKRCAAKAVENLDRKAVKEFTVSEFFNKEENEAIQRGSLHDLKWKNHPYCKKLAEAIGQKVLETLGQNQ